MMPLSDLMKQECNKKIKQKAQHQNDFWAIGF